MMMRNTIQTPADPASTNTNNNNFRSHQTVPLHPAANLLSSALLDPDNRDWFNVPGVVRDAILVLEQEQNTHSEAIAHVAKQLKNVKQMHKKCCHQHVGYEAATATGANNNNRVSSRSASQEVVGDRYSFRGSVGGAVPLDDRTNRNLFHQQQQQHQTSSSSEEKAKQIVEQEIQRALRSFKLSQQEQITRQISDQVREETMNNNNNNNNNNTNQVDASLLKHIQLKLSSVSSSVDDLRESSRRPTFVNESDIRHVVNMVLGERAVEQRQHHFDATVSVLCSLLNEDDDDRTAKLAQSHVPAADARDANRQIHHFLGEIIEKKLKQQEKRNQVVESRPAVDPLEEQKLLSFIDSSTETAERLSQEITNVKNRQKQLEVKWEQFDVHNNNKDVAVDPLTGKAKTQQQMEEEMEERLFARLKREFVNPTSNRLQSLEDSVESSKQRLAQESNRLESKILEGKERSQEQLSSTSLDLANNLQKQCQQMINKKFEAFSEEIEQQQEKTRKSLAVASKSEFSALRDELENNVINPQFDAYRKQSMKVQNEINQFRLELAEQQNNLSMTTAEIRKSLSNNNNIQDDSSPTSVNSLRQLCFDLTTKVEKLSSELSQQRNDIQNAVSQAERAAVLVSSNNARGSNGVPLVFGNSTSSPHESRHGTPTKNNNLAGGGGHVTNIYNGTSSPETNASTASPDGNTIRFSPTTSASNPPPQPLRVVAISNKNGTATSLTIKELEETVAHLQSVSSKLRSEIYEQEAKVDLLTKRVSETSSTQGAEQQTLKDQFFSFKQQVAEEVREIKASLFDSKHTLTTQLQNQQQQVAALQGDALAMKNQQKVLTQQKTELDDLDERVRGMKKILEKYHDEAVESAEKMIEQSQKRFMDEASVRIERQDSEIASVADRFTHLQKSSLESIIEVRKSVQDITSAFRGEFTEFKNKMDDQTHSQNKLVEQEASTRKEQLGTIEKKFSHELETASLRAQHELKEFETQIVAAQSQFSSRFDHLSTISEQTFVKKSEFETHQLSVSEATQQQQETFSSSFVAQDGRLVEAEKQLEILSNWSTQVEERNSGFSEQYVQLDQAIIRDRHDVLAELDGKANELDIKLRDAVADIGERIAVMEVAVQGYHQQNFGFPMMQMTSHQQHSHFHHNPGPVLVGDRNYRSSGGVAGVNSFRSTSPSSGDNSFEENLAYQQQLRQQQQQNNNSYLRENVPQQPQHQHRQQQIHPTFVSAPSSANTTFSHHQIPQQQQQQQLPPLPVPISPNVPSTTIFNHSADLRECQRKIQSLEEHLQQISQHQRQLENAQISIEEKCFAIARDTANSTAEKSVARIRREEQEHHHQQNEAELCLSPMSPLRQHEFMKKEREEMLQHLLENVEVMRKLSRAVANDHVCADHLTSRILTADAIAPVLKQLSNSSIPSWVATVATDKSHELWTERSPWLEKRIKDQVRTDWEPAIATAILQWRGETDEKIRQVEATAIASANTAAVQTVASASRQMALLQQQQQQSVPPPAPPPVQLVEIPSHRLTDVENALRGLRDRFDVDIQSMNSKIESQKQNFAELKEKFNEANSGKIRSETERLINEQSFKLQQEISRQVDEKITTQNQKLMASVLSHVQNEDEDLKKKLDKEIATRSTNAAVLSLKNSIEQRIVEIENNLVQQQQEHEDYANGVDECLRKFDNKFDGVQVTFGSNFKNQRDNLMDGVERRCSRIEDVVSEENRALVEDMSALRARFEKLSIEFSDKIDDVRSSVIAQQQQFQREQQQQLLQQQKPLQTADESMMNQQNNNNNNISSLSNNNNENSHDSMMLLQPRGFSAHNLNANNSVSFLPRHPTKEENLLQHLHNSICAEVQSHCDRLMLQQLSRKANATDVIAKEDIKPFVLEIMNTAIMEIINTTIKPSLTKPLENDIREMMKDLEEIFGALANMESKIKSVATSLAVVQNKNNTSSNFKNSQQQQQQNSRNFVIQREQQQQRNLNEETDDFDAMNNPPQMSSVEASKTSQNALDVDDVEFDERQRDFLSNNNNNNNNENSHQYRYSHTTTRRKKSPKNLSVFSNNDNLANRRRNNSNENDDSNENNNDNKNNSSANAESIGAQLPLHQNNTTRPPLAPNHQQHQTTAFRRINLDQ